MFNPTKLSLLLAQLSVFHLGLAAPQRLQTQLEDTLTVSLFNTTQGGCAGNINPQVAQQNFTIGASSLKLCFIVQGPFLTATTRNVAQSLLGRNLAVLAFDRPGCGGTPVFQTPLSNSDINCCDSLVTEFCSCDVSGRCLGQAMRSFEVAPLLR